jgi:hypothetical protein
MNLAKAIFTFQFDPKDQIKAGDSKLSSDEQSSQNKQ